MYKAIYCKPILESLSLLLKMKNSNPEDSLFLSCGLKTSFLALCLKPFLFLLSILPKKTCLLVIISKNNTCIYNTFFVDSVLSWWVNCNMLPASTLYDLLGIVSCVLKQTAESWMGCGLAVFLSISTNEIGFKRQLQLQFPWWWNPTQRYKGAVWLLQLQYIG